MRRREFITLIGSASAAWPLAVRAQQPASAGRRLGVLLGTSAEAFKSGGMLEALTQGMKEYGWVDGQSITFEYRFVDGNADALPKLAAELVQLRVDVILTDGTSATQAAKNATQTVPIVMAAVNDPVASGFIASFKRPGGNITGLALLTSEIAGRRLQLLTEMVPDLARVAVLSNPLNPSDALLLKQTQAAAQSLGIELQVVEAPRPDKLESAFAAITTARASALIVLQDAMFFGQHPRIVAMAAVSRLPTLFPERQVVEAGGLMSYGPSIPSSFRRAALYVDKILRGANPADLPVELPTTFEFVINLKTAKALGLTVPDKLLSTADEIIE
jgi:putative tryptophan/tyrosine transport system substrate-binding protein